jgi:hypothetical protein
MTAPTPQRRRRRSAGSKREKRGGRLREKIRRLLLRVRLLLLLDHQIVGGNDERRTGMTEERQDMNALLRQALGVTEPEPTSKRDPEEQTADMNARLEDARHKRPDSGTLPFPDRPSAPTPSREEESSVIEPPPELEMPHLSEEAQSRGHWWVHPIYLPKAE